MKGFFITLEGIDGAGKSTQAKRLETLLSKEGSSVLLTREPTDGPYGRRIRRIAAEGRGGIEPLAELELFLKDREEHCREVIAPALQEGRTVVCDRYYHSTMAYQGALGLDPEEIRRRNEERFPRPDLVLYLRLSPEAGLDRIRRLREGGTNVGFEREDYLRKVAEIFDSLADANLVRVDASGNEDEVAERIAEVVKSRS